MKRIGIVGFGKMGQIRAEAFLECGAEIAMIYDPALSEHRDFVCAADAREIIDHPEIDAVVVCMPNFMNFSTTMSALEAGKHVFCEKPPAFNANEVSQVMELEESSELKLMYGFNHRVHDAVIKMKQLIDSGRYGKVLWMRGRYGKSVDGSYMDSWRAKKEYAGGGILMDQGIHMLDLFLHLGGSFDDVHAFVSNLYWKLDGVEDNVFAIMKNTQTGLVASLHSTMTQWRHLFSLEVFLEAGYMVLNGLKTSSGTYGEEVLSVAKNRTMAPAATWDDEEKFHFQLDNSWKFEAETFLRAITDDEPIESGSSRDAFQVMQLIDRIYENDRHELDSLNLHLKTVEGGR